MQRRKILAIGAIMVDIVWHVPTLPKRGGNVVITGQEMHLGGCAYNSANIIRQLGGTCDLMAPVGQGVYGDFVRRELERVGFSAFEPATDVDTGSCVCLVEPDGERTMVTSVGIEQLFEPAWFEQLDADTYFAGFAAGYEIVGVGGGSILGFFEEHPAIKFFYAPGPMILEVDEEKRARIIDLHPLWHLNDMELLDYAKAYLGFQPDGDEDAIHSAGKLLAREHECTVVVTLGAKGAAAFFPDGTSIHVPTEHVTPIDTIGAGDSHLGALAHGLSQGMSWEEALCLANRIAGIVCLTSGATLSDEQFHTYFEG